MSRRPNVVEPGECPAQVRDDLEVLAAALDEAVPAKAIDRNVLMCTWNIRGFGRYTPKWIASSSERPRRDLQSIQAIAEIVSRFDVVAIQEVKSDTAALRALYGFLGEHWSLLLTDVTEGKLGNAERMAFVFDTRRVRLSGLACEVVIPPEHLESSAAGALQRQFARTPYAVGFRLADHTITLVALHVIWGDSPDERVRELAAIAEWLAKWSRDKHGWDHNLITLGDFNIDREEGPYYAAFTSTGLYIPPDLRTARRSIFGGSKKRPAVYDQIAWFEGVKRARPLDLTYARGGSFDFASTAMRSRGMTRTQLSWCLSDHLPLWVEFKLPD
jgi:endonuclease/exonuclease/phosphatase family metal-dependent hydrolase